MKAKLILFAAAFFIFNSATIAQNKNQKVKNTNTANNANPQKVKTKSANGNTQWRDDSLLWIKSSNGNVKQPAGKAKVKQGGK